MNSTLNNSAPRRSALVGGLLIVAAGLAPAALADVVTSFGTNDGGYASTLNSDSFDGPWTYNPTGGAGGTGSWQTTGQSSYIGHTCTTDLTSGLIYVGATGQVDLAFSHRYSFEFDGRRWDGGAVFISRNGGAFTMLDNSAFWANGYNAIVDGWDQGSELANGLAFTETSAGYGDGTMLASMATLGNFDAGDTIQLRFRASFDSNTVAGSPSWEIGSVEVTNAVPGPGAMALLGAAAYFGRRRRA